MDLKPQITTDDGSRGERGYVTQKLNALLLELQQQNQWAVVYSCGPTPMLRAVAEVSERLGVKCQVSLEENMPCGIGVCNGCVVATRTAVSSYERYRRVCIYGPAMWAEEVDWEAL
jgi:dihydroorotate dehydrogenase electron transfer subunit